VDLSNILEPLQQTITQLQTYIPKIQSLDFSSWLPNVEPIIQQAQQILAELWTYIGGLI